jgi:hypothetical protein
MGNPTNPNSSATFVSALFRERDAAERAYRYAVELGYESSEINILLSEETRERYFSPAQRASSDFAAKAGESTEASSNVADELGGPAGGTAGTIAPALAAIGTLLLVPGLGILAAGPVAIALTAAGAVGVTGGLIAALTDWGIPKDRVQRYDAGIREGGILLAVKARSPQDASALAQRWKDIGGDCVA